MFFAGRAGIWKMSFSSKVKEELYRHTGTARHCQIAELAAILHFCGSLHVSKSEIFLKIRAENALIVRKCFTLLEKAFNMSTEAKVLQKGENGVYQLLIDDQELVRKVLQSTRYLDAGGEPQADFLRSPANRLVLRSTCCQRAFLRGAFLCAGSMSDPEKGYHLEIVCGHDPQAMQVQELLAGFGIEAHIVTRKKYRVVYVKEGSGIADFLNLTEAHRALLDFENSRVFRDVRNTVNRRVNCETANIAKTVNAAAKQVEDILFLKEKYGLEKLPANLRQMAQVRLENPDASLKELGACLDPPVGKSGVNHRLRKLCELADNIRS